MKALRPACCRGAGKGCARRPGWLRLAEGTAIALIAFLLWWFASLAAAVTFLAVELLLAVWRPRGLRLGPWLLWVVRIPQGPKLGVGRIAVTDTPRDPAPGQTRARDGQGRVLFVCGVAFAALRCRSVPIRAGHP